MVRQPNVGRSRACAQCKKKRIKCDLASPTCQRCIDSNLICSGPVQGLLLIQHQPGRQTSKAKPRPDNLPDQNAVSLLSITELAPTAIYDDVLLARFLHFFSENIGGAAWQTKLPKITQAKNQAAATTAIRAVSLAYAAHTLQNTDMATSAREFYGNSLRYHQASFRAPAGRQICKKKAINALPVTILLSYFEMIQATSRDSWFQHVQAAEGLFLLLGPDALQDELFSHIYFILRAKTVIRAFLSGGRVHTMTDSPSIPMAQRCGPTAHVLNQTVDVLLQLSQWRDLTDGARFSLGDLHRTFDRILRLWRDFTTIVNVESHALLQDVSLDDRDATIFETVPLELQRPGSALTASFLHGAMIMLVSLAKEFKTNHAQSAIAETASEADNLSRYTDHSSVIPQHAVRILALAKVLRQHRIGCACLRMMLPLAIVHRLSPVPEQASFAETFFRQWARTDGLAGLGAVGFGSPGANHTSYTDSLAEA